MKHILSLVLCLFFTSCDTTSPGGQAFTEASTQTLAYFAAAEVLSRATTVSDWQSRKDVLYGMVLVLQGVNHNATDPVEVRLLLARYLEGRPAHWLSLSQLVVSWINSRATNEGRSALLNATISGFNNAIGGAVPPAP